MLSKLFKPLKIKKSIEARDWTRNNKLIQSGVCTGFSYSR